jgi:hypothetical protein
MIEKKAKILLEKEILTEKGARKLISYAKENPNKRQTENLIILDFLLMAFGNEFMSRFKNGAKLEKQIKEEDEPKTFYWALPLPGVRIIHQLIHPNRSTNGLTRTRTLHDLKGIGLINELTFNEALLKLNDFTIVEEVGLIGFVLEREEYCEGRKN